MLIASSCWSGKENRCTKNKQRQRQGISVMQYHTVEQMMGHIVPSVGNTVCFQKQFGSSFVKTCFGLFK